MSSINNVLEERGTTHGSFSVNSNISQAIKTIIKTSPNYWDFTTEMAEALDMIAHKISRICSGQPNVEDHWVDIAGYSLLVASKLKEENKQKKEERRNERKNTRRNKKKNS